MHRWGHSKHVLAWKSTANQIRPSNLCSPLWLLGSMSVEIPEESTATNWRPYWLLPTCRIPTQRKPHIHMLVWIKNAPLLNTSSKEDIIDFIERNITCKRPEEKDGSNEEHNTLAELVKFQLHRHSHTRKKGNSRKCCFNIPLPPMKETQILEPIDPEDDTVDIVELRKSWQKIQNFLDGLDLGSRMTFGEFLQKLNISEAQYILGIRSSLKQPTVFLRWTPWEIRVNAYNKHIILAWRAHMDIQYVMDVYACAKYVASYITKSQRGISELLRKASEEARTGNQDIPQQLRMVSNKFLNSVELSAQEAVYICLQLPMKKSSRQVVFINTNLPEDCVFLLKPNHVLQTMRGTVVGGLLAWCPWGWHQLEVTPMGIRRPR